MDSERFDRLVTMLSTPETRRGLVRGLAALPLAGGVRSLLGEDAAGQGNGAVVGGGGGRKRPKRRRHDAGQNKRKNTRQDKRRDRRQDRRRGDEPTEAPPPPPPSRTPVRTQAYQCPGPLTGAYSISNMNRWAQTFTAGQSGSLLEIQFEIIETAGVTGNFVVELLEVDPATGFPTNTVLATAMVPDPVPPGAMTLTATFSGPPLVAGTQYAAAISRPAASLMSTLQARTPDPCAGSAFTQTPIGGSFGSVGDVDLIVTVTVLA